MEPIRLNKYLSSQGVGSRRKIDELVAMGHITINGHVAAMGEKVDPEKDIINIQGHKIAATAVQKVYYMLHKPLGYITTTNDEQNRPKVTDLVPPFPRVVPIGRLDAYTTGLLLLTNDGKLVNQLTHPKHHIGKTYELVFAIPPSPRDLKTLQVGVVLEDGKTQKAIVKVVSKTKIELTIFEGRNRQIRRMCTTLGLPLKHLHRIKVGQLSMGHLAPGKYRQLTAKEIEKLYLGT